MSSITAATPAVNPESECMDLWGPVGRGNAREYGGGDPPAFEPDGFEPPLDPVGAADRAWWARESGRAADRQDQRDYYRSIDGRGDPRDDLEG